MNPMLIVNHVAEEAIAQYELVAFGSARGRIVKADGANAAFGVSCQPGTSAIGDRVDVVEAGIVEVRFGGEVAAGGPVTANAAGHAVAADTAARVIGYARHAAVDGEIGEITLAPAAVAVGLATGALGLALVEDETAADARATLELGDAATLDVGAVAGTVCAGDDARLSDARQPADDSVSTAKLNGSVDGGCGVPFMRHVAFEAGESGSADDVLLSDGNFPRKARLVAASAIILAGAAAGRTVAVAKAAGGAPADLLAAPISAEAVGFAAEGSAMAARPVLAAGSSIYLRRSHDAVGGELLLTFIPEA